MIQNIVMKMTEVRPFVESPVISSMRDRWTSFKGNTSAVIEHDKIVSL